MCINTLYVQNTLYGPAPEGFCDYENSKDLPREVAIGTVECGSNIISSVNPKLIGRSVEVAISENRIWTPPEEYLKNNVSDTVVKIILGYNNVSC